MKHCARLILVLSMLTFLVAGCDSGYRAIRIHAGHASAIRMASLWDEIAAEGEFDPSTAGLQRLWLEYSPSGVLLSASIQAFIFQYEYEFLQIGFINYDRPGDDLVSISGGISSRTSSPSYALPPAAEVFAAIDAVGPGRMIALLGSSGSDGRYAVSVDGSSIPEAATAYFWDGSNLADMASTDTRREYSSDSVHLVAYTAMAVSSPTSEKSETVTTQYQGSGPAVYFVIPISSL
jgi:hypothetical protein